ncbi:hypothetical protein [Fimbriiglobus ruber]|uniref:Uncharacterized protein n=1 Tax=Fimbriiglobus ruber TaxID=1908690 RepID=A0A225E473_9BACT|nr:hypothetical protein [Fimbriiglobus ruber]OWK43485.1 hypothetical protein FRUB_03084 [Fimbriiglobus ruber]
MADDGFDDPGTGSGSTLPGGFRMAVAKELNALGFAVTKWHEAGLDCTSAQGKSHALGLTNLYRRAKNADRGVWPELIRDFLKVIVSSRDNDIRVPDDLAEVADRLIVRIGAPFPAGGTAPWFQPLPGTDLVTSLVIDSEQYMTYVTRDMIEKSTRPPGEWLDRALENLRAAAPSTWLRELHAESGVLVGHANDSYDAARALVLGDLRDPGPGGWLVAVPARDWLFALPVSPAKVAYFHLLKILAEKNHAREPYPISNKVYWVRGRQWQILSIEIEGGTVRLSPSPEFAAALGFANDGEDPGGATAG